jgi:hypothetical protein
MKRALNMDTMWRNESSYFHVILKILKKLKASITETVL